MRSTPTTRRSAEAGLERRGTRRVAQLPSSASTTRQGPIDAVILAAGHDRDPAARRKGIPPPLLPIAGRPLLELHLENLARMPLVQDVTILTNSIHHREVQTWFDDFAKRSTLGQRCQVLDNRVHTLRQSRGAAGDLAFFLDGVRGERRKRSLLVIGGDNYLEFELSKLLASGKGPVHSRIALCDVGDRSRLASRFGSAKLDSRGRITEFEEKPEAPTGTLASTLCYLLTPEALGRLPEYVNQPTKSRDLGSFLEHLVELDIPVYGHVIDGGWYDVGNDDEYRQINQREAKRRLEADRKFMLQIEAVILFADIIGSVAVAEHTSDTEYDRVISEFQAIALDVINRNLTRHDIDAEDHHFCEHSVRGDEAVLLLYTKRPERDAKAAVDIAIELKRRWLLSDFNRRRKGKAFYDVGVGIHYGPVIVRQHPSAEGARRIFNAEGYSISLAKRIETYARSGRLSRIMLSRRFSELASLLVPIKVSERVNAPLQGIYGSAAVHELEVHGDIEDPEGGSPISHSEIDDYVAALENSGYDMWLLLLVARYFYDQEDYASAQRYYKEAIERFPDLAAGYTFLGRSYYRQRRFAEARRHLQKAYDLKADSSRVNTFLAVTLRRLGDYPAALQHHEQAVSVKTSTAYDYNAFAYTIAEAYPRVPDAVRYSLERARYYLEEGERRFSDRRQQFAYVLDHTRGLIQLRDGRVADAVRFFERALQSVDDNSDMRPGKREEKGAEILYHLGCSWLQKEKPRAEEYLTRSLSQSTNPIEEPYYWTADAIQKLNDLRQLAASRH